MDLHAALMARADELMQHAPGRVSVQRISQIDDVRVLRAARETLTDEDQTQLAGLRLATMERLDGVLADSSKAKSEPRPGLMGALSARFSIAAEKLSSLQPSAAQGADGPMQLPAPAELLDAAENWALAHLVANRVDLDLSVLRRPWEAAVVEPQP